MVVRIRVSPKDCMSVVDAARLVGVPPERYSMSALTSLVLSSLLEVHRKSGLIPERSGFEYSEMMEPFRNRKGALRQKMTEVLYRGSVPTDEGISSTGGEERTEEELKAEFSELNDRWDTLTSDEKLRYNYLNQTLFGA